MGLALFGLLGGFLSQSLWQGISVAWAAQDPGPAPVLEVREIRLLDQEGVLWGRLGQSPRADGQRGLILYDEQGRERGRLALASSGHGGLVLSSPGSAYRLGLTLSRTAIPALSLTDREGRIRSLLLVDERGPQVDLYSETSDIVLGLEAAADGPRVRLREAGSQDWVAAVLSPSSLGFRAQSRGSGVTLGLDQEKSPRLVLVEEGKPVASLPPSPQE
ncbi:MAG TPA: hypothetical protein VLU25_21085 [Acidobacteriota bacterium]|nr:hypothetical protein [Acidobacteriota bacterium]